MTSPLWRYLRLLAGRPLVLLAAGLLLTLVAEGSSVGLLALSGWFIASCYLSGAGLLPGFSYLAPSGAVRSLATSRVLGRYAESLVNHTASLRWLTRLRTRMFLDTSEAGPEKLRRLGTGQALDRAMTDADTLDRVLIRVVVPTALAGVAVPVTALVVGAIAPVAGLIFAVGGLVTIAVALRSSGTRDQRGHVAASRGQARAHLIQTIDAWEELACLGVLDRLHDGVADALAHLQRSEQRIDRVGARAVLMTDVCVSLTLIATLAVAVLGGAGVHLADATLILLLVSGTLDLVARLPAACDAWRGGQDAAARLAELTGPTASVHVSELGKASAATAGGPSIEVTGLSLAPDGQTVTRLHARFAPGALSLVQGRSGSGKTTLLRALAGELAAPPGSVLVGGRAPQTCAPGEIVFVAHDDFLFSGTVADNMRLADPALTDDQVNDLLAAMWLTQRSITASTRVGAGGRALSGGEQRRLCLARAVAARPPVLLLDEPTEGLDPSTARHVLEEMRRLLPATTVVAAIHNRNPETVTDIDSAFGDSVLTLTDQATGSSLLRTHDSEHFEMLSRLTYEQALEHETEHAAW